MSEIQEIYDSALGHKDGFVVVLEGYIDESGTDDGSDVITVAAYYARPRTWAKFIKEWNRKKKPIQIFHAVDCANFKCEFEGWEKSARDKLVKKLLPIIGDNPKLIPIAAGLVLKDFDALMPPNEPARKWLGSNYEICFQWTIQAIIDKLKKAGNATQQIAFIHETNDYKHEALRIFAFVQERNPDRKMTFSFGSKKDYVALQAADILAYESNKRLRHDHSHPDRRAFAALKIKGKGNLFYYDKKSLPAMIERVRFIHKRIIESGLVPTA